MLIYIYEYIRSIYTCIMIINLSSFISLLIYYYYKFFFFNLIKQNFVYFVVMKYRRVVAF